MRNELICEEAKKFLGTPYIWGGVLSSNKDDSSGFVQFIFETQGIDIPRFEYEQYEKSKEVEFFDIQKGDLLFNKDKTHVGIYIGNVEFIHAPKIGDKIRIDKLFNSDMKIIRRVEYDDVDNITGFILSTLLQEAKKQEYAVRYGRKNDSLYYITIKNKSNNEIKRYKLIED